MNGSELVDYVEHKTIDMVFLDYLIPFVNGIECSQADT